MTKTPRWILTVSEERPIAQVAADAEKAGLRGVEVMAAIGCITGTAPAQAVARLRKVRGVVDVAPDTPIDIGPPDAGLS